MLIVKTTHPLMADAPSKYNWVERGEPHEKHDALRYWRKNGDTSAGRASLSCNKSHWAIYSYGRRASQEED